MSKITHSQEHEAISKEEARVAEDLCLAGKLTYSTNPNHPGKHYLAYKYLGPRLLDHLKKPLSLDERYELAIKIVLQLHELHSGSQSKSNIPYLHGDIHRTYSELLPPNIQFFPTIQSVHLDFGADFANILAY